MCFRNVILVNNNNPNYKLIEASKNYNVQYKKIDIHFEIC